MIDGSDFEFILVIFKNILDFSEVILVTVRDKPSFNNGLLTVGVLFEKIDNSVIVSDRIRVCAVNDEELPACGSDYVTHTAVNQRMVNLELPESGGVCGAYRFIRVFFKSVGCNDAQSFFDSAIINVSHHSRDVRFVYRVLDYRRIVKPEMFVFKTLAEFVENVSFNVGIKEHMRVVTAVIFTEGQTLGQGNCIKNTVHGITS
jgi:hypothetical protein